MRQRLTATGGRLKRVSSYGPRVLVLLAGLVFLGYGAVLAWRTDDSRSVLAVGGVFVLLALVVPNDWRKLKVSLPGGGSLEVERENRLVQETLASLPHDAQEALLPDVEIPDEAALTGSEDGGDGASEVAGSEAIPGRAQRLAEYLINRVAVASHDSVYGQVQLRLKRRVTASEPPVGVFSVIRRPDGSTLFSIPRLIGPTSAPQHTTTADTDTWLEYEIVFPDWYGVTRDEVAAGRYWASWVTLAGGQPAQVLATDEFSWPPA